MELVQTFIMCCCACLLISAAMLIHPLAIITLVCVLGMIFANLLASLNVWDLELNAVSSICLVMSMGLVVDYCAHIMHKFLISDGENRDQRVRQTLLEMGSSVSL